MAKLTHWLRNHLPTQRRLIQLYAALLYNAHLKGYISGNIYTGSTKSVCVPGFNCYSCPGAVGACPLGALQNAIASSGSRTPVYVLGILLLYGITLGRTICGFLCPVGLLQELLHKIPSFKVKKGRVTRVLSYLKYVILAIFVILVPLWYALQSYPVPAFCKYICPAGTFEGAIGLLSNPANRDKFSMLGILFTRKFVIMLIIALACVFIYRAFCRFLCPLGAIYGLFAKIAVVGVKVEAPKCTSCGRCTAQCPMVSAVWAIMSVSTAAGVLTSALQGPSPSRPVASPSAVHKPMPPQSSSGVAAVFAWWPGPWLWRCWSARCGISTGPSLPRRRPRPL